MRALPFLAALLCTATFADAKTELELLQDRCAEQERQIRQLEEENSRLSSLVNTAARKPDVAKSLPAAPAPEETPGYGVVRSGDNLSTIAKRHGTTTAVLAKLNKLKNPSLIRPGQKLRLPDQAVAAAEKPSPSVARGTHKVKSGETFFSIARRHALDAEALQAANPSVKAERLRPGQILQLEAKGSPSAPPKASSEVATREAPKPAASPAPVIEESSSQTVAGAPRIRSVAITENTDFGAFAAAHGTSTAKLNALNGLNLNSGTVLAKGSELYVPAQP